MALIDSEANQIRIKGANWQRITEKARLDYTQLSTILAQHSSIQTASIIPIPEDQKQTVKNIVTVTDTSGSADNLNDLLYQLFIGSSKPLEIAKKIFRIAATIVTQENSIITTNGYFYRDAASHPMIRQLEIIERNDAINLFSKYYRWMELLLSNEPLLVSDQDVGALLNVINVPTTVDGQVVSDSRYVVSDVMFPNGHISTTIDENLLRTQIQDMPLFGYFSDIITDNFNFGTHRQHLDVLRLVLIYAFRRWFTNAGLVTSGIQIGALSTFNRQNALHNGDDTDIESKGRILPSLFLTALLPSELLRKVKNAGGETNLDEIIADNLEELMSRIGKLSVNTPTKITQSALDKMFNGLYKISDFGGKNLSQGYEHASKQSIRFSDYTKMGFSKVAGLALTDSGSATLPTKDAPDPSIGEYYARHKTELLQLIANERLSVDELSVIFGGKLISTDQKLNQIFKTMLMPSNTVTLVDSSKVSFPTLINQCITQNGIDKLPKDPKVDIPTLIRTNWDISAETISELELSDVGVEGGYDYSKLFKNKPFTGYDFSQGGIKLGTFGTTWYTDEGVRQVALSNEVVGADMLMARMLDKRWNLPSEPGVQRTMLEMMKDDMASENPTLPTILAEGQIVFLWSQFATIMEHDDWNDDDVIQEWKDKGGSLGDHVNNIFEVAIPMLSKAKMSTVGDHFSRTIRDTDGTYAKEVSYNILDLITHGTSQIEGGSTFQQFIATEPELGDQGYNGRNLYAYFTGLVNDNIPIDKITKVITPAKLRSIVVSDSTTVSIGDNSEPLHKVLESQIISDNTTEFN
ncbi:P7 [Chiqui virus]|uniref:P7 n=1 Tax=Chiqui virus TaxID=2250219 RepID=UPI000DC792B0|nr:P7 [Chiqui virus]AWX66227.1 P7 [Chiqui virus]